MRTPEHVQRTRSGKRTCAAPICLEDQLRARIIRVRPFRLSNQHSLGVGTLLGIDEPITPYGQEFVAPQFRTFTITHNATL